MANSVDSDHTLHSAASDLVLHCLQIPVCPITWVYYGSIKSVYQDYDTSMRRHYKRASVTTVTSRWCHKRAERWLTIMLTLLLLSTTYPVLANSVDPDQLASEEAN